MDVSLMKEERDTCAVRKGKKLEGWKQREGGNKLAEMRRVREERR